MTDAASRSGSDFAGGNSLGFSLERAQILRPIRVTAAAITATPSESPPPCRAQSLFHFRTSTSTESGASVAAVVPLPSPTAMHEVCLAEGLEPEMRMRRRPA